MKLEGTVAIVTGGGRGIGRAIALRFAQEGAAVGVAARTTQEIDDTAAEISRQGGRAIAVTADVSKPEDVDRLVGSTRTAFGTVHVLVNNAGVYLARGPLAKVDLREWMRVTEINLFGTMLCARAVLPLMIEQRRGKIINLVGAGAFSSATGGVTAYGTSKAAICRFTELLAAEVQEHNIQVNSMHPGFVITRMTEPQLLEYEGRSGQEHPNRRRARPPEMAAALAVFLASGETDDLTGRHLSVADDWAALNDKMGAIMASELYTLRRVAK